MRHTGRVSTPDEPHGSRDAEFDIASAIVGNRTKADIVKYLWLHGPTGPSELMRELGMLQGTVSAALRQLEQWAVVASDIPVEQRRGRTVTYTLNRERLQQLIDLSRDYIIGGGD